MLDSRFLAIVAAAAGLLVLVTFGYWAIVAARTSARSRDADRPSERLEALRAAYEAGEMDKDEFERVRSSIERGGVAAEKLKVRADVPRPSAGSPSEQAQPVCESPVNNNERS